MTMHRRHATQHGGAAILAMVGILAMAFVAALSVDIGVGYHEKRKVKSLAQAAVLAAAQEAHVTQDTTRLAAVAAAFAEREGYKTGHTFRAPGGTAAWQPCAYASEIDDCVEVTTSVVASSSVLPNGGYRVTIKRLVPTTFGNLLGRRRIEVMGTAVAAIRQAPIAVVALHPKRKKSFSLSNNAKIRMTNSMLTHVNSDQANALLVAGKSLLDTYLMPRVHGNAKASGTAGQYASGEPGAAHAFTPGQTHAIEGQPCMWDPFRASNTGKGACQCATGCEPDPPGPPKRPIPEIDALGKIDGYDFTVQCGTSAGGGQRRGLLLYDGPGYPRQNNAKEETAVGGDGYTKDPTKWDVNLQFPAHDEENAAMHCPGIAKANALGGIQPVASLKDYTNEPDGEYVLCPGIYYGGVWVRNTKVRFATCADPLCTGRCHGDERTHPVFVFAGGGLKVQTTRAANPKPPYGQNTRSATRVTGVGVTLIQSKHKTGDFARISIDKNSDVYLKPPPMTSLSVFKGISIYVDRDYKKSVNISGRALAGPAGGISGDIYAPFASVVVRGATRKVAEIETGIRAAFIVASLRFGGELNENCDPTDPEDDDCTDGCIDELCAEIHDPIEKADCEDACVLEATTDDDPEGAFQPEDGGASASRIVLAPVD